MPTSTNPADQESVVYAPLLNAIYAFSARWLPLLYPSRGKECPDEQFEELAEHFWRKARQDMLKLINQSSYRAVLTMLIFGLTPLPCGISKSEEMNGLSGYTCLQLALQKLQALRARPRTLQFSLSSEPASPRSSFNHVTADMVADKALLDAEAGAYLVGLIMDTASSLTLDRQSVLCSGLLGFEFEATFELIRKRSLLFQVETESWLRNGFVVTDDTAMKVIGVTSRWKLYTFKRIALFKEALRDGHDETKVTHAFVGASDAIAHFQTVYQPILDVCEKKLYLLSRSTRLVWYVVLLHYYLGVLILADAIQAVGRTELLDRLSISRMEAVQCISDVLTLGLKNTFSPYSADDTSMSSTLSSVKSFVAWDPYPHHTVAAIQLAFNCVSADFTEGSISRDYFGTVLSTLLLALKDLACCSKFAQTIQQTVAEAYEEVR
ncbi:hypothetical protein NA57DRAFT_34695 [Rhizodiscina lignyota]|uniref:Uncharacterized protein n=1 Tax=Rhizodiscina lignyota TaxID=1504668 RepID=A0A9P4M924_9PEZI|nr:hypothetical protein NA57DRAFT_34695 [Rhizodiscina lignyota]